MRIVTKCLVGAAMVCMVLLMSNCASAGGDNMLNLNRLVTAFEDARMNSHDLAFYLVTHGYNAKPMDGYVELELGGKICRLTPNGNKPGLCDIAPEKIS
jgi:hypothetical protein